MASSIKFRNNIPILNKAILEAIPKGLVEVGKVGQIAITSTIDKGVPPPNAPATIKAKGSSGTLRDDFVMYGHVTSEVSTDGKSVKIGVMGDDEAAKRALINEFGAPNANIPERSFIRSTFNNQEDRTAMNEEVIKVMRAAFEKSKIR